MTETAEEPVEETVEEPVAETVEEPVEETVEEPVAETAEEPVEETVEEPAAETVEEPVTEPVEEPVEETAEEPVTEPVEEPEEEPEDENIYELTNYVEYTEHRSNIALVVNYFKNTFVVFFWAILLIAAVVGFVASIVVSASAPASGLVVFGNCFLLATGVIALLSLIYYVFIRTPIGILSAVIEGRRIKKQKFDDIATVATIKRMHENRNSRSSFKRAFTLYPFVMDKEGKPGVVITDILTYLVNAFHLTLLTLVLAGHLIAFLNRAALGEPTVLLIGALGLVICGIVCLVVQLARDITVATVRKELIKRWSVILEDVEIK